MNKFEIAVDYVLKREGGLSENRHDSGGITNYGISLRFLRTLDAEKLRRYGIFEPVNEDTVRDLTLEQAKFIYKGEFWENSKFEFIESQKVCNYFFDMAVNMGISQATKIVQRAICAAFFDIDHVKEDGVFGSKTLNAINVMDEEMLMHILVGIRASYYRSVAEYYPKDRENLNGWLNRAYQIQ